MKTVDELAKEWVDLNLQDYEGYGKPLSEDYEAINLDGGMIAAYKAGYAQACYEALTNFPPIKSSGGWKLATIQIGGEEEKE